MSTPTLYSQSKTSIGVKWTDPLDNGGAPITYYLVEMDGGSGGRNVYSVIATIGNQATDFYVTVPGTTPLITGDTYNFRIVAKNVVGLSTPSTAFLVMAAIAPSAPGTPTKISASTTEIYFHWTAPTDNGGTPITDYNVYWDEGTGGSFTLLGTSLNMLSYTKSGLSSGVTYKWKVTAINYISEGAESAVGTIIAATVPDQITNAPAYVSSTKTSIAVSWIAPYNGGTPITGYKILMNAGGASTTFTDVTSSGSLSGL